MSYLCALILTKQQNTSMKTLKTMGIMTGLLLAVSFTSCQKEKPGVYSPKKKIQQIYCSTSYSDKEPFQHWEWNGDKLNSITHYSDFDLKSDTWVEDFTYDDNNRVIRVDNYTNSEYITYEYDGKHLKSATVFYRNTIVCTWTMTYDGDKISKMTGTFYDSYKKDGATLHLNPLSHLLSPKVYEKIAKCERQMAEQRHQEETYSFVLLFTWTDNNISKIVLTGDGEYMDFQLQYDDKNCPLYGFMGGLEDYLINFTSGHTGFTKNNVTRIIMTEDDYADTICYSYQYNSDKYPVLQTMYNLDNIDYKQVLYFEY